MSDITFTPEQVTDRRAGRWNPHNKTSNPFTVDDRRIQTEPNTGCWLWTGFVARNGYGSGLLNGRSWLAHRAAYTVAKGQIPSGLVLDHICRVRSCCNPDHLRAVTLRENTLENSCGVTARNRLKTACGTCGSPLETLQSGRRVCRPCRRASFKRWRSRNPKVRTGQ